MIDNWSLDKKSLPPSHSREEMGQAAIPLPRPFSLLVSPQRSAGGWEKVKMRAGKYSPLTAMLATALLLTACGIKGDLVRPSDVPQEQQEAQKN